MRSAEEIRDDLAVNRVSRDTNKTQGQALRAELGKLLREASGHPELTIEEAREIADVPRVTAYELRGKARGNS